MAAFVRLTDMAFVGTRSNRSGPRAACGAWARAVLLAVAALGVSAQAQTLAHRNWAGNGITSSAWWQNAVFYAIDVDSFQDSDGDGKGDLAGILQRFDYLQSLGVDAILIEAPPSAEGFDELIRAANAHHLRVVVTFPNEDRNLVADSRKWLTHGAAGIVLGAPVVDSQAGDFASLRRTVSSFPGDRVLIAAPEPTVAVGAAPFQLVTRSLLFPGAILSSFSSASAQKLPEPVLPAGSLPIVHTLDDESFLTLADKPRVLGLQKILAARLFLRPGSAWVRGGEELGAQQLPPLKSATLMSWTPTNVTTAPKVEEESAVPTAPDPATYKADTYTGYKPYVAPKPKPKPRDPSAPADPTTLPGFSTKPQQNLSPNIATANVATEDADSLSLLHFYRRLSQLHHDHPALRGGEVVDIDLSALQAFAWVIKPPASARAAHTLVVVANFSDKPKTLSIDDSLSSLHLHSGGLRPLVASWTMTPPFQYTRSLTLPPFSVLVAEL